MLKSVIHVFCGHGKIIRALIASFCIRQFFEPSSPLLCNSVTFITHVSFAPIPFFPSEALWWRHVMSWRRKRTACFLGAFPDFPVTKTSEPLEECPGFIYPPTSQVLWFWALTIWSQCWGSDRPVEKGGSWELDVQSPEYFPDLGGPQQAELAVQIPLSWRILGPQLFPSWNWYQRCPIWWANGELHQASAGP